MNMNLSGSILSSNYSSKVEEDEDPFALREWGIIYKIKY